MGIFAYIFWYFCGIIMAIIFGQQRGETNFYMLTSIFYVLLMIHRRVEMLSQVQECDELRSEKETTYL